MDTHVARELLGLYPALNAVPEDERNQALEKHSQCLTAPAGTLLFDQGAPCRGFPMVLTGQVRVARGSPGGRSLELYRVGPGEICVVSTASLFGQSALAAHGQTRAMTEIVLLSHEGFESLTRHEPFRRLIFSIFAERLADLMALAEALAFQRLDQRLAHALLGHGQVVTLTHQALADELGTVREIVTRLLKRFEHEGWVLLARERIEITDAKSLRAIAAGQAPGLEIPGD